MKRLTIAIAGCGVAGLACATLLRRQGAHVVLFDKLETPQPLGSGIILQPVGLRVLDEIGVGDQAVGGSGDSGRQALPRQQPGE